MQQGKSDGVDTCDQPDHLAQMGSISLILRPV